MNILFYFDRQINPERGGTERVTYNLAHYFQGKGYRMLLLKHSFYPITDLLFLMKIFLG